MQTQKNYIRHKRMELDVYTTIYSGEKKIDIQNIVEYILGARKDAYRIIRQPLEEGS